MKIGRVEYPSCSSSALLDVTYGHADSHSSSVSPTEQAIHEEELTSPREHAGLGIGHDDDGHLTAPALSLGTPRSGFMFHRAPYCLGCRRLVGPPSRGGVSLNNEGFCRSCITDDGDVPTTFRRWPGRVGRYPEGAETSHPTEGSNVPPLGHPHVNPAPDTRAGAKDYGYNPPTRNATLRITSAKRLPNTMTTGNGTYIRGSKEIPDGFETSLPLKRMT